MEEKEVLIEVENLSKKFCKDLKTSLWYGVKDLFSSLKGNKEERLLRPREFWALKDINFELRRGECLGLIGHNGAGKSTLLKILNGLLKPDAGKVTIKGKVGALIELGAGFNPILTGRENIYNNGAVLGFTRKEIDRKLEEIIDFAEIREFIDMPVQNYSSGMKVRLGFAIASQMEPDVLIIDEVLAVGDVGFHIKCLNRISELLKKCAVIFVSHSMPQVAKISTSTLLLEEGKMISYSSNVSKVVLTYLSRFDMEQSLKIQHKETLFSEVKIMGKAFDENLKAYVCKRDEEIEFQYDLEISPNIEKYCITLVFNDVELKPVAAVTSLSDNQPFINNGRRRHIIKIKNYFAPGRYSINCNAIEMLNDRQWGKTLFQYQNHFTISVINANSFTHVPIQLKANWN
ncbi:ABC transporter ATP-binding protein [Salinimicrobium xinjiangense]|uniref:ABC transporter ATP-binding protein n=1 Tax=Salinimicrobium xinjiangense TaxID=438596 RepID=UPI0004213535|nr:ABC transporter ATP-binding protein [Salinimicrobium xinjiangense]